MRELDTHVLLSGKEYPINYDFRIAMKCDSLMNDPDISDEERGLRVTGLLFGKDSPYTQESLDKAQKFLSAGVVETDKNNKNLVSFEQHFDLFYSAFKSQYDIDLYKDELHYYQFVGLLQGMRKQVLTEVIEILNMNPSEEKDFKRRQQIIKAQNEFKIKRKERTKLTKNDDFLALLDESIK